MATIGDGAQLAAGAVVVFEEPAAEVGWRGGGGGAVCAAAERVFGGDECAGDLSKGEVARGGGGGWETEGRAGADGGVDREDVPVGI